MNQLDLAAARKRRAAFTLALSACFVPVGSGFPKAIA